jgi:predicted Zn finger-like uncharacterized protein
MGGISKVIAAILGYALPEPSVIIGKNIPILPIGIGFLMYALALLNIVFRNRQNSPPDREPSPIRWVLLCAGIIVPLIGYIFLLMSIYAPESFGAQVPVPKLGVSVFLPVFMLGLIVLYFASRMNSKQRPNLFRWITYGWTVIISYLPTMAGLILVYAVPTKPLQVYPFLTALLTTAYVPCALLIVMLTRDHVKPGGEIETQDKEPETREVEVIVKPPTPPVKPTNSPDITVIVCETCNARYRIPTGRIPSGGTSVKCKKCQGKITLKPSVAS